MEKTQLGRTMENEKNKAIAAPINHILGQNAGGIKHLDLFGPRTPPSWPTPLQVQTTASETFPDLTGAVQRRRDLRNPHNPAAPLNQNGKTGHTYKPLDVSVPRTPPSWPTPLQVQTIASETFPDLTGAVQRRRDLRNPLNPAAPLNQNLARNAHGWTCWPTPLQAQTIASETFPGLTSEVQSRREMRNPNIPKQNVAQNARGSGRTRYKALDVFGPRTQTP